MDRLGEVEKQIKEVSVSLERMMERIQNIQARLEILQQHQHMRPLAHHCCHAPRGSFS